MLFTETYKQYFITNFFFFYKNRLLYVCHAFICINEAMNEVAQSWNKSSSILSSVLLSKSAAGSPASVPTFSQTCLMAPKLQYFVQ